MYHGMVVRFDFSGGKLSEFGTFMVTQRGDLDKHDPKRLGMGGVWQAGNGLVADKSGNIYFMTGNGGFDGNLRYGSNFVELDPDLKVKSWFAPWNVGFLNDGNRDIDLGASGPVLLPGTQQIVGGGKQGKLYLLKLNALGGKQKFGWLQNLSTVGFLSALPPSPPATITSTALLPSGANRRWTEFFEKALSTSGPNGTT